ncbi:alpha/beta-hydrolase [Rozella allomycis CSF55]|uniref:Alpha/beta-hydrolase n=1 Tax=Rozella allomycis (strain CSF55) TaxID=988480 RepID=A0A075B4P4_ROZAC|nr:Oxidative stress survival, Svf1-like domain-containing protein [Rozella allomycis CSF55]RKP17183.1 alpha/beta-hydrolase [Rozella allomycis CSF55]|eukprot:EPZ36354.1 Oxidative stress survival, Svf1-like domain-containing protein [Rozella allomycis CSF55]
MVSILRRCKFIKEKYWPAWYTVLFHVLVNRIHESTPDGGEIYIDIFHPKQQKLKKPIAIIFPGFVGGSDSNVVRKFAQILGENGWQVIGFNFRGCNKSPLRTAKTFSAEFTGDFSQTIALVNRRFPGQAIFTIAISYSCSILIKLLASMEDKSVVAAVVIAPQFDFVKSQRSLTTWPSNSLCDLSIRHKEVFQKSELKIENVLHCERLSEYDGNVTVNMFSYPSVNEYYKKASAKSYIPKIKVPTLLLCALDDPLLNADTISFVEVLQNPNTVLVTTKRGGHLGWLQSETILSSNLGINDLKWTLTGVTNESQVFYVQTDDKSLILVQIIYSAIGLSPFFQVNYQVLSSQNGIMIPMSSTTQYSKKEVEISGDNVSTKTPTCSYQVADGNKVQLNVNIPNAFSLELDVEIKGPGFLKKMILGNNGTGEYSMIPRGVATGKLVAGDKEMKVNGFVSIAHAFETTKPHQTADKVFFCTFHSEKLSFFMVNQQLDKRYDNVPSNIIAFVDDEGNSFYTSNLSVKEGECKIDQDTKYAVPTSIDVLGEEGSVKIASKINLVNGNGKVDVLKQLPFLVRKVIQALVTKPFVYPFSEDAVVEIEKDGRKNEYSGRLLCEVVFINE